MKRITRFLLAMVAGLVAGAAVAKLPPPTPEEKAKTEKKKEEKKADTERDKKATAVVQDRIARAYRAEHADEGAMPANAVSDQLMDSDVPSGAKAPDVPHPGTGG